MSGAPRADAVEGRSREEAAETFVVFAVDGVRYGLPVARVQRTLPYPLVTRIPAVPMHVLGVFQHGGRVITLWDLHALLGAAADPAETPWVVVTESGGRLLGLAVDRVEDVVSLEAWSLGPVDEAHPQAIGVLRGVIVPDESEAGPPGAAGPEAVADVAKEQPANRGAEQMLAHGPVHLVDLSALRRLGAGEGAA